MEFFLTEHTYGPLVISILMVSGLALLAYLVVFRTKLFDGLIENPLVPTFINVPASLLGLILAFMASAVWQNSTMATQALKSERMAIKRLYALPIAPQESKRAADKDLDDYVQLVQEKEWGRGHNSTRLPAVDSSLDRLFRATWKMSADPDHPVVSEYIRSVEQLETAREARLTLGELTHFDYLGKWIIIYFLTWICAMTIAAVHRENRRSALFALALFCTAVAAAYSLIALYMHPYTGPSALMPTLTW